MFDVTLPTSLGIVSIRTIIEATLERKTATHAMMLWKYDLLNQDDAL
jgi:hypothetical protein